MSARTWVAAPLAGAVIALAAPPAAHAGTPAVPTRHASAAASVHGTAKAPPSRRNGRPGGGLIRCPVIRVRLSSDRAALLSNCRRGPRAIIVTTADNKIDTFLDVNYPEETSDGLEMRIIGFFRRRPVLLVKYLDSPPRWIYFPPSRYHYG